jgi:hypothetical protein
MRKRPCRAAVRTSIGDMFPTLPSSGVSAQLRLALPGILPATISFDGVPCVDTSTGDCGNDKHRQTPQLLQAPDTMSQGQEVAENEFYYEM